MLFEGSLLSLKACVIPFSADGHCILGEVCL